MNSREKLLEIVGGALFAILCFITPTISDAVFDLAIAPAIVGGLVAAGGSLIGGLLGKSKVKPPPQSPDYRWIKEHGPGMWDTLKSESQRRISTPYGIPQGVQDAYRRKGRAGLDAGYASAGRERERNLAVSGLSGAGGDSARMQYYQGQELGRGIADINTGIELADYQAQEEQRNQGLNMMMALSNKSPVYSQIASQNYWNAVNANQSQNNMWMNAIGGMSSDLMTYYLNQQYLNQQGTAQISASQSTDEA